jgi:hypothetical protein
MSRSGRTRVDGAGAHKWLRPIRVAFLPDRSSPLLDQVVAGLMSHFHRSGHIVQDVPDDSTDVVLTTAVFGVPLNWRKAALFSCRRKFGLRRVPTVFTLVSATPEQFDSTLGHFESALLKEPPDPGDFNFPGLAASAYEVLVEQGKRGGAILALERLVQAQAKSIRLILVVGEDKPLEAYHFDLVGAYPRSDGRDPTSFYEDIVLRIATAVCTRQVSDHTVTGAPLGRRQWEHLGTPAAMRIAGEELGKRGFFTEMVVIGKLTAVPAVGDVVASQYSEGCFATWEPAIPGLIATVTGSARPVVKGRITDDDLAVVVGVREDGCGAIVRRVTGLRNDPPSSEAVEMMLIDSLLPSTVLGPDWDAPGPVPVVRSKLHVHRGIAAYDPVLVEYAPLDGVYHRYLVTCGTGAQAEGITQALGRAEALRDPSDPRQVAFTVLPGHGTVIVEKWVPGERPFEIIWQYVDAGHLMIASTIPQGPMHYVTGADGQMTLSAP